MKNTTLGWEEIEKNCVDHQKELIDAYDKLLDDLNTSWEETMKQIQKIMRGEE